MIWRFSTCRIPEGLDLTTILAIDLDTSSKMEQQIDRLLDKTWGERLSDLIWLCVDEFPCLH